VSGAAANEPLQHQAGGDRVGAICRCGFPLSARSVRALVEAYGEHLGAFGLRLPGSGAHQLVPAEEAARRG
jgi:hypothetical protein